MPRTTVMAVAAVVASAAALLAATPAAALPPPPEVAVSLGDSFISGEGGRWQGNANTVAPGGRYGTDLAAYDCNSAESWCSHDATRVYGPSYANACDRSPSAEVHRVTKVRIEGVDRPIGTTLNVACSGATSEAIHTSAFKGEPRQVDQLAAITTNHRVRLVVLSIGGNDIGFEDIIKTCVIAFSTGATPCARTLDSRLPALMTRLTAAVTKSITAIRTTMTTAGYGDREYRFVLQSYPSLLPRASENRYPANDWSRLSVGGCPFTDEDSNWASDRLVPTIADTLGAVARKRGVEFLDVRDAFAGHEVCAEEAAQATAGNTLVNPQRKADAEWVRWIGVPTLGQGDTREYFHPNRFGQQELGTRLAAAVSR